LTYANQSFDLLGNIFFLNSIRIKRSQQRAEAMHALATAFEKMETHKPRSREDFRGRLKELESALEPYVDLYAEKYSGMEGDDGQPLDDGTQPFREKLEEVRSLLAELDKQDRARG
jgi:hypothetical protein